MRSKSGLRLSEWLENFVLVEASIDKSRSRTEVDVENWLNYFIYEVEEGTSRECIQHVTRLDWFAIYR